jgi:hypothetical protein
MELPETPFYLFGMGPRRKLLYRDGTLSDIATGEVLRQWDVASCSIFPDEYSVSLETKDRDSVSIFEDEEGVWIHEESYRRPLISAGPVRLPRFEQRWDSALLRALHQEVLINILGTRPVPNLFVYDKPWYRDAAMVCMCLEKTGNLDLVRDWVLSLTEPFDLNNGNPEPDNLGQALYMISLFADASHPLVEEVLDALRQFRREDYIVGITDGAEHPVYQTKWIKFGLRSLGLGDPFNIPEVFDSYSALFWMDYRGSHVKGPPFSRQTGELYPYLAWAEAHFEGWEAPEWARQEGYYPLSWEAQASKARYEGMAVVDPQYVARRIAAPHSWHAAEMFLYLLEKR